MHVSSTACDVFLILLWTTAGVQRCRLYICAPHVCVYAWMFVFACMRALSSVRAHAWLCLHMCMCVTLQSLAFRHASAKEEGCRKPSPVVCMRVWHTLLIVMLFCAVTATPSTNREIEDWGLHQEIFRNRVQSTSGIFHALRRGQLLWLVVSKFSPSKLAVFHR